MTRDEDEIGRIADESLLSRDEVATVVAADEQARASSGRTLSLNDRRRKRRRFAGVVLLIGAYVAAAVVVLQRYAEAPVERPRRVVVRGDWLYRDGHKLLVKGIGWDPARPGELPWARDVSVPLVDDDFRRIRDAGFNTIRTWDALSRDELAAADRHGLSVLQGIWIAPDGAFSDEAFRRDAVKKVRDVVGYSKESRAVLGYLVMNEPKAAHVRAQGLDETRAFLRLVREEIRALDPDALVSFASWPGSEMMHEAQLDFAAANLHPFRPSRLLQAVGYEGMVRIWKDLHGKERPLLVTEYGLSVAPRPPATPEAPGGATEEEQARRLPEMADRMLAAGAAGGAAFAWIDGWWKGQDKAGDERTRDEDDAEEWFGLVAMDDAAQPRGRDRPALWAMKEWQRVVVTSPPNGLVDGRSVLVEVHAEDGAQLHASVRVNGGDAVHVDLVREGPWLRGRAGLSVDRKGAQRLDLMLHDARGALVRHVRRVVFPPGEAPELSLTLARDGGAGTVEVVARDGAGAPLADVEARVSLTSAEGTHDALHVVRTDAGGRATVQLALPDVPGALIAAAIWPVAGEPPAAVRALVVEHP